MQIEPVKLSATGLNIEEIIDISVLQRIQDSFAKAMDVAAVTVNRKGEPITRTSNFQPICLMIRSTPAGLQRCFDSDAHGGLISCEAGCPQTYLCPGGMMDMAAPIIIEGEYVGCILCGQVVLTEERDLFVNRIIERNKALGLPYEDIVKAAYAVPAVPRERLEGAAEMLFVIANHIIEMGIRNITQTRLLQEAHEKAALQSALQHAQLRALESQVNPHFLFNALTLVGYTAIEEGAPRTEEITYCLSDLLRYSLRNVARPVMLAEELEMIERYLAIQRLRFGSRLQVNISVNPMELAHVYIPCMILQPLVENAVIYSVEPLTHPVHIELRATQVNNRMQIDILDDGVGMEPQIIKMVKSGQSPRKNGRTSLGLQSVLRRLQGTFNEDFSFEIESSPNHGTHITLLIPLQKLVPVEVSAVDVLPVQTMLPASRHNNFWAPELIKQDSVAIG